MKSKILNKLFDIAAEGIKRVENRLDERMNGPLTVPTSVPRPINEELPIIDGELMANEEEVPEGFVAIPIEQHIVRTEVARQIEASFSSIIWMERGGDEIEVIVTRVYPVHIEGANTYTCMVGTGLKEGMTEEIALPLHQFLQAFAPVGALTMEEYQA